MVRKTSAEGIAKIKQWEGCRLTAYMDTAGKPTIGYGHTKTAHMGMTITQAKADALLKNDLLDAEIAVERYVKVPLNDNQHAALVSFVFNVGVGDDDPKTKAVGLRGSTLLKKLNSGDYDSVPQQLSRFVFSGGKRDKGLVNRRAQEAALWGKGSFVSSQSVSVDKPIEAPIATNGQKIGATVAAIGATASAAATSVQPLVPMIPHLGTVFAVLSLIGIAAAAYATFRSKID